MDAQQTLAKRLIKPKGSWVDVRSTLRHFALVTYAVPADRLRPHIPAERFDIAEFDIGGQKLALLSAVPFWDEDFRFVHAAPFIKRAFGQTNHRVYVIDRRTGEHCVWFFGTTLGSWLVFAARLLWGIPWHHAHYETDCVYNPTRRAYDRYHMTVQSDWCSAEIDFSDTGAPTMTLPGFATPDELTLILTHPVEGFFYRLGPQTLKNIGTYSVWHEKINFTLGHANHLYFSLYERLGILSRAEMQHPHSILICPQTEFEVFLPPRRDMFAAQMRW